VQPERDAATRLRDRLQKRGIAIAVSGIDGSGKTTICKQLLDALTASGLPVTHVHIYRWHRNLLYTPWLLLHNRWRARRVLLFDRTIFDNVAVAVAERRLPRRWLPAAVRVLCAFYPSFDYRFFLTAPFEEIAVRRPGTTAARYSSMLELYRYIFSAVGFTELRSDASLFANVLRRI